MTIQAKLADGRVLQFPDGTDPLVIQTTVKKVLGVQEQVQQPDTGIGELQRTGLQQPESFDNMQRTGVDTQQFQRSEPISTLTQHKMPIDQEERQKRLDTLETIKGIPEAALTVGTSAIAEPIAGISGIVGQILPGEENQGLKAIESTREALTFKPRTEAGVKALTGLGDFFQPIAELTETVETGLGDFAFKATGSSTIAAAATTIPTIISEIIGAGAGKFALNATRTLKKARSSGRIAKEISEAVPTVEQLKDVARGVYKEIDDAGAVIKEKAFESLSKKLSIEAKKAGLDPDITPKASKALSRFSELEGEVVTVSELDTLRKVSQNAASAIEPAESALGVRIINTIDEFMDKSGPAILKAADEKTIKGIGKKYQVARDLWGRARKSELLQESFEKARNQASGFENGVRVQFRSILNNKKKRRFFNKQEIQAMTNVVRGGKAENFAKLIGRLGFAEGGATNIIGGSLGIGGGAALFGPAGAVAVPLVGQVSRKLAQRMTVKGAEFADQVIRAGKNAEMITKAYLDNTPKALRSSRELSQLLMRPDIDLTKIPKTDLVKEAARIATENRAIIAASVATPELIQGTQQ